MRDPEYQTLIEIEPDVFHAWYAPDLSVVRLADGSIALTAWGEDCAIFSVDVILDALAPHSDRIKPKEG